MLQTDDELCWWVRLVAVVRHAPCSRQAACMGLTTHELGAAASSVKCQMWAQPRQHKSSVPCQVCYITGLWHASLHVGRSNLALPCVIVLLLHPMSFLTGSPVLAAVTTLRFPLAAHVVSLVRP